MSCEETQICACENWNTFWALARPCCSQHLASSLSGIDVVRLTDRHRHIRLGFQVFLSCMRSDLASWGIPVRATCTCLLLSGRLGLNMSWLRVWSSCTPSADATLDPVNSAELISKGNENQRQNRSSSCLKGHFLLKKENRMLLWMTNAPSKDPLNVGGRK